MTIDVLVAVALVTGLVNIAITLLNRGKTITEATRNRVDAATLLTNSAMTLIVPLEERITQQGKELDFLRPLSGRVTALEGDIVILHKQVAAFRRGVMLLCSQIRKLGAEPVWLFAEDEPGVTDGVH